MSHIFSFQPMKDRDGKNGYKRGETRERSDDIMGDLMCINVEVPTSAVTGRGRAFLM